MPRYRVVRTASLGAMLAAFLAIPAAAQMANERLHYPDTRRDSTVDDYFGTKIAAPYRWMEDDNSAAMNSAG